MKQKMQLTEAQLKQVVSMGTKYVLEQVLKEAMADNSKRVMVNLLNATDEWSDMDPEFDNEAEWLEELPFEIPVEVLYSKSGGDPDTYDTPGTEVRYDVADITMNPNIPGINPENEELLNDIVLQHVDKHFQDFMFGDRRYLKEVKRF